MDAYKDTDIQGQGGALPITEAIVTPSIDMVPLTVCPAEDSTVYPAILCYILGGAPVGSLMFPSKAPLSTLMVCDAIPGEGEYTQASFCRPRHHWAGLNLLIDLLLFWNYEPHIYIPYQKVLTKKVVSTGGHWPSQNP